MLRGPALADEQRGADGQGLAVAPLAPGFQAGIGAGGDLAEPVDALAREAGSLTDAGRFEPWPG